MKAWFIWRAEVRETSWAGFGGLADIACVSFDEEEAVAIERTMNVAWARANPRLFLRMEQWSIENELGRASDTPVDALSDDDIMHLYRHDDGRPFVIKPVELDELLALDELRAPDRADVVRGLADLLRPLDDGAAAALAAAASRRRP